MIRRVAAMALAAGLLGAGPAGRAPTPRRVLDDGLAFVGGKDALRALTGIQMAMTQTSFALGQEEWPGAPLGIASELDGTEVRDYARPGVWTRYHLPNAPNTFRRVFLPDSAGFMNDTNPGLVRPGRNAQLRVFKADPVWLFRQAADAPDAALRSVTSQTVSGRRANGVEIAMVSDTFDLWFDVADHKPLAIDRKTDDPVTGPTVTRQQLSTWARVGAVLVPFNIITTTNGVVSSAFRITTAQANPVADSLFNGVRKNKVDDFPGPAPKVVEIVPGIYRLEGSSGFVPYNPVAVQQGDSVVILDMPLSDAFTRAVLDSLRSRFPRTPVRTFVVSHHHADHLGGVRAAFTAGLRAIAPEEIADYVRHVGLAPGQKPPASRRVTGVHDSLPVGTGPTRFVLYQIPTSHARGLMMAYFPEQKLLAEVDLAAGPIQDREDLFDFLQSRRLVVDRFSSIHGTMVPWASFLRAVPSRRPQ